MTSQRSGAQGTDPDAATAQKKPAKTSTSSVLEVPDYRELPTAAGLALLQRTARDFGLSLVGWCRYCGRPLTASKSLHRRMGPVCHARHGGDGR